MADMKMGKDEIRIDHKSMIPTSGVCPSCGKMGMLQTGVIEIPVDVRIIFRIRFTARIRVQYDPSCGFFRILLNQ